MNSPKICKNFIGGEWADSTSGAVFEDRNPANTDEVVAIFPRSSPRDVASAVEAASPLSESEVET